MMLMKDMNIYSNSLFGNVVIFNVIAHLLITLLSASILLLTCKRKPQHSKVPPKKLPPSSNLQPQKYPSSEERPSSGTSKPKESTSSQPPPKVPKPKKSEGEPELSPYAKARDAEIAKLYEKLYEKFTKSGKLKVRKKEGEVYKGIPWMDDTTPEEAAKLKKEKEDRESLALLIEIQNKYRNDKSFKNRKMVITRITHPPEHYIKKYGREWAICNKLLEPQNDHEWMLHYGLILPEKRKPKPLNLFKNDPVKKKGEKYLPDARKSFTASDSVPSTFENDDDEKELTLSENECCNIKEDKA